MKWIGQSAGKDNEMRNTNEFAYILGVFMGDGCVTYQREKRIVFKMNTIDKDFADTVYNALEVLDLTNPPYRGYYSPTASSKGKQKYHHVCCQCPNLAEMLINDTKDKTIIPDYVFTWDKELQKHFVAGLMDSEGYVCKKNTIPKDCIRLTDRSYFMGFKVCDNWAVDFAKLLNKMGIRTGKLRYEKIYGMGTKTPIHFSIKMSDWVKEDMFFNIMRKQERINTWKNAEPYSQRTRCPRRSSSETICTA